VLIFFSSAETIGSTGFQAMRFLNITFSVYNSEFEKVNNQHKTPGKNASKRGVKFFLGPGGQNPGKSWDTCFTFGQTIQL
jgi:hypothetical protein